MFAFALWDSRRRQLLLARDRVGKKPLFYCERPGALSFASELAALMQNPEVPRDVDHQALDAYLAYGYVPAPTERVRGGAQADAGEHPHLSRRSGSIERYWRLDYSRKRRATARGGGAGGASRRDQTAVRRRMVADVPMGAFLSGGIDSSTVVAAMAESSSQPVKTFSIGFEEERFNELPAGQAGRRRSSPPTTTS